MTSSNEALKRRVEAVLDMAVTTVSSLSEAFSSGVPVASDDGGLTQGKEDLEKKLEKEPQQEQEENADALVQGVANDEARVESNGS